MQRSALIAGLSLALCGLTLAGVGEWASGRSDSSAADSGRASAPASYSSQGSRVVAAISPSLPTLPETSDHLPTGRPGYTLRHIVPEVRLQFTVADEHGRLVLDLSPDDVRIFDDQAPVASLSHFERAEDLPLHLGLILDTSDSVKRVLPQERAAAVRFLQRVMRASTDDAFIMAFAGDIQIWQNSTDNRQDLIDAVARLQEPGWGTRLFDALYSACAGQQLATAGDGRLVHRAIVVLSDGDDTDSFHELTDVIAIAQRSEIQIYALTIHAGNVVDRGDRILRRLAEATGGRGYVVGSSRELDAAFAQIEQELRTQYYVSFSPQQLTPGFHALRVEVRAPQKLEVHARQGYYVMAQ